MRGKELLYSGKFNDKSNKSVNRVVNNLYQREITLQESDRFIMTNPADHVFKFRDTPLFDFENKLYEYKINVLKRRKESGEYPDMSFYAILFGAGVAGLSYFTVFAEMGIEVSRYIHDISSYMSFPAAASETLVSGVLPLLYGVLSGGVLKGGLDLSKSLFKERIEKKFKREFHCVDTLEKLVGRARVKVRKDIGRN